MLYITKLYFIMDIIHTSKKMYLPNETILFSFFIFHQQIENAYRRLMEKFSSERHNVNRCEGEFGLYYEQKMKDKIVEEYEKEKQEQTEFDIEVKTVAS